MNLHRLAPESPDAQERWAVSDPTGRSLAAATLWWQGTPPHQGRRVGAIGRFSSQDPAASGLLLEHACRRLAEAGCDLAVGPMDRDTWHGYRVVAESSGRPPFFLELETPLDWQAHFRAAGFFDLASYISSRIDDPGAEQPRMEAFGRRLDEQGITVRPFDPARAEDDLALVHDLNLAAFTRNLLYTPLALPEFIALYRPVLPLVRPEYFLLAVRDGVCLSFVFAVPDHLQARRGEPVTALVVKTAANRPGRAAMGLAVYLAYRLGRQAVADGYGEVIHALMHEANVSTATSRRGGSVIRRYVLFARDLT